MYTADKFRIIGQARSSFHLGVLESVYIKTQDPMLCRQKEFVFSLGLFNQEKGDGALIGYKNNESCAPFSSHVVFDPLLVIQVLLGVWQLSDISYSDECRTKKHF